MWLVPMGDHYLAISGGTGAGQDEGDLAKVFDAVDTFLLLE